MKKTFLQMISEYADAANALKDSQKKRDESGKVILDPETGHPEYVSTAVNIFKNKKYFDLVNKFKNDNNFKNQFNIIKNNNILYLNRLLRLIKSQDPSLENLKGIFSTTKNDKEYFSNLKSFIVPFSSIVSISKKIKHEELWEDEGFLTFMRFNAFNIKLPSGNVSPNEDNVSIVWNGKDELSIREFSNIMKIIISDSQKYVDVRDFLIQKEGPIKDILLSKTDQIGIREKIAREKFIESLPKFISLMKFRDRDNKEYFTLKNIDASSVNKELKKLEDEKQKIEKSSGNILNALDDLKQKNKELSEKEDSLRKDSDLIKFISFINNTSNSKQLPASLKAFGIFTDNEIKELEKHSKDFSIDKLNSIKTIQPLLGKIRNDILSGKIDEVDNIIKPIMKNIGALKEKLSSSTEDVKNFINMIVEKTKEVITHTISDANHIDDLKKEIEELKIKNKGIEELDFINNQINKIEENQKHVSNFTDAAFIELLSGDNTDDITFIFKDPKIYLELIKIKEIFKPLEELYNSYTSDCKKIVDSSFLDSDKIRSPFITVIKDLNEIIKKTQEIGKNLYDLKDLIKEANKKGRLPYEEAKAIISKIDAKKISVLYDDIVKIILRFKTFLRVEGFITKFANDQYHNQLDIAKLDLSTADDLDNYYVQVSIVPEDVRNQSTYQYWTSCQTLSSPTGFNDRVGSGYLLGTIGVFLLALDYSKPTGGGYLKVVKNISHKDFLKPFKNSPIKTAEHSAHIDRKKIMSIDEFKEKASKGIMGTKKLEIRQFLRSYAIRPIGRVLIKNYNLTENGIRSVDPQLELQGGLEEESSFMKIVDNLYSVNKNDSQKKGVLDITDKNGNNYKFDVVDKYTGSFIRSIKALGKRLNLNVKTTKEGEGYNLPDNSVYDDTGIKDKKYTSTLKKFDIGANINFSRETTEGLLSLLAEDKNMIRLKTFRHALFSKDRIDGTLDLSGTKVESLDPMHPTNLPSSDVHLSNDRSEKIDEMNGAWMVNDNFRKDSGDFAAPLTKSELALYEKANK